MGKERNMEVTDIMTVDYKPDAFDTIEKKYL
jgi:hypothetical protein